MDVRSALGSLQLPVAGTGAVLVAVAVGGVVTLPSPPPGGEGFLAGLAVVFLYFLAWVGFVLTAVGLAIPPGEGYGVAFTRAQRTLFAVAAVAGVASGVVPFVAFGLVLSNPSLMVTAVFAIGGVAVAALVAGLGWRGVQVARSRRSGSAVSAGD